MSLWLTIPLGVGIIAAFIAVIRPSSARGLYTNGIIESCLAMGTDHDCLQVRAYVDETLVHELPTPSQLISRMFIRETNTSVPLTFVRVPPYGSPKVELVDEGQERADVPVVPVIFGFDPLPMTPATVSPRPRSNRTDCKYRAANVADSTAPIHVSR